MPKQPPLEPKPRPAIKHNLAKYKVVKRVSDNLISLQVGDSIAIRVTGTQKMLGGGTERWGKNKPPVVLPIEVLPEEKAALLILQTVLESKFDLLGEEAVGKCFLIEAHDKAEGKAYRNFDVDEIEI